jgi:lipid II:glycine glycyltransferase (peptidoglycan interpeptide bridge formation enzyme)
MPLQPEGDRVETLLERLGFVRRRVLGGWTTVSVDLTSGDDDDVFAGLRSATRRAIRKSQRVGIEVRREDDADGRAALAGLQGDLETRQPVEHTDLESLARISEHWLDGGRGGAILVARKDDEPLAAGLVIIHRDRAYLPFIPSSHAHRDLPSSHLLVWEAIRWARARGCASFDLVGYSMTARPGDALWGINQFKRGFAPIDRLEEFVAIHELVRSPAVVAAATATRRLQEALRRRGERP